MKKLLSVLATLGLTATSSVSVVACDGTNNSPTTPENKKDLSKLFSKNEISGYDFRDQTSALAEITKGVDVDLDQLQIKEFNEADHDKAGSFIITHKENSTKYKGEFTASLTKWTDNQFVNEAIKTANHFIIELLNTDALKLVEKLQEQVIENIQNEIWDRTEQGAANLFKKTEFTVTSLYNIKEKRTMIDNDANRPGIFNAKIIYSYGGIENQETNLFINPVVENASSSRTAALTAIKNAGDPDLITKDEWLKLWMDYSTVIIKDIVNEEIVFDFPDEYAKLRRDDTYIYPWQVEHLVAIMKKEITFIFMFDLKQHEIVKGYDENGFKINIQSGLTTNPGKNTFNATGTSTITLIQNEESEEYEIPFTDITGKYNPIS